LRIKEGGRLLKQLPMLERIEAPIALGRFAIDQGVCHGCFDVR
jgi:hypothetical protein